MAKRTSQFAFSEFLVLSALVALGVQVWMLFPNYGPSLVLMTAWFLLFMRCGLYQRVSSIAVQASIVLLVFYARFRGVAGQDWWLAPFFLADAAFYTLLFSLIHVVSLKLIQLLTVIRKNTGKKKELGDPR